MRDHLGGLSWRMGWPGSHWYFLFQMEDLHETHEDRPFLSKHSTDPVADHADRSGEQ
jgi:hypothetical protein